MSRCAAISSARSPEATGDGFEALAAQKRIQQAALPGVVIHDQDARCFAMVRVMLGGHVAS